MRQPLSYSQKGFYMSLLDKMERKFGKYAIPNLMQYTWNRSSDLSAAAATL